MFRNDIVWLVPAILTALLQVKWIWRRLPQFKEEDTVIAGKYLVQDLLKINYLMYLTYFVLIIQLVKPIFTITDSQELALGLKIGGYFLVMTGFSISVLALKELGTNWTGMCDYRIKKGQQLVTTGIYSVIRHPIYSAVLLELVGFELIANSWIFMLFLIFGFYIFFSHSVKEEQLLSRAFEEEFADYKHKTKMFLPWLF